MGTMEELLFELVWRSGYEIQVSFSDLLSREPDTGRVVHLLMTASSNIPQLSL